jgi:hypothetical protein
MMPFVHTIFIYYPALEASERAALPAPEGGRAAEVTAWVGIGTQCIDFCNSASPSACSMCHGSFLCQYEALHSTPDSGCHGSLCCASACVRFTGGPNAFSTAYILTGSWTLALLLFFPYPIFTSSDLHQIASTFGHRNRHCRCGCHSLSIESPILIDNHHPCRTPLSKWLQASPTLLRRPWRQPRPGNKAARHNPVSCLRTSAKEKRSCHREATSRG